MKNVNQTNQTKIMQEDKVWSAQEVQNCGDFETKITWKKSNPSYVLFIRSDVNAAWHSKRATRFLASGYDPKVKQKISTELKKCPVARRATSFMLANGFQKFWY